MSNLREKLADLDFVGKWKVWLSISSVLLVLGASAVAISGLNLGIDFTGGTEFTITEPGAATSEEDVAATLPDDLAGEATIQTVGSGGYSISVPPLGTAQTNEVRGELAQDLNAEVSATNVSPTFGGQSLTQALQAVGVALLVIVVFISYRFELAFAMATMVALLHDILLALGFYALVQLEISLVTVVALLTILGYSVYDTIIIFDRIRENVPDREYERERFEQEANRSVRQVVRRSIYTSLSTLIPLIALFLFGSGALVDFAIALIVGVVAGAYSSIFIATPVLALYKRWRGGGTGTQGSDEEETAGPVV